MLFTPLRTALIAGAGVVALGGAAGVTVHSVTAGSPNATLTASTSTPSVSPNGGTGAEKVCKPERGLGPARGVLSITASVTGQTEQQILDQLRTGKTLNQVAGDKAAAVEQQAIDKLKAGLDKRVAAGKLNAADEKTRLDSAKAALDKAMAADLSGKIPAAGATACAPGGLLGTLVKVTADRTGMTVQQVMDALKAGKSIDQIAGAKAAEIKAAVLQQEQQRQSSALDNLMGRAGLQGGPGAPGKGHGHGKPGGPAAPGASPTPSA